MDGVGDGGASTANGSDSSGEPGRGDERLTGRLGAAGVPAADIRELSRRALSAEIDLLAYVGELEDAVRRLRRRLDEPERYEKADGIG
jgi:hypothetical protein